jgi:hypothetical protein
MWEMTRNSVVLGVTLATLVAAPSHAQITVDFAKITCKQLFSLKVKPEDVAIWLSGYYNAKGDNTVIDVERLKDNAKRIKRDCLYGNAGTVMEAVEKRIAEDKHDQKPK